MANRLKRRSLAVATPTHSPGGGVETDRESPMVIPPNEVNIHDYNTSILDYYTHHNKVVQPKVELTQIT